VHVDSQSDLEFVLWHLPNLTQLGGTGQEGKGFVLHFWYPAWGHHGGWGSALCTSPCPLHNIISMPTDRVLTQAHVSLPEDSNHKCFDLSASSPKSNIGGQTPQFPCALGDTTLRHVLYSISESPDGTKLQLATEVTLLFVPPVLSS
jgi:hypothetical protein